MHILQLSENYNKITNVGQALNCLFGYEIVNKFRAKNISLVSYDAYIISVDFLSKNYEKDKSFF